MLFKRFLRLFLRLLNSLWLLGKLWSIKSSIVFRLVFRFSWRVALIYDAFFVIAMHVSFTLVFFVRLLLRGLSNKLNLLSRSQTHSSGIFIADLVEVLIAQCLSQFHPLFLKSPCLLVLNMHCMRNGRHQADLLVILGGISS